MRTHQVEQFFFAICEFLHFSILLCWVTDLLQLYKTFGCISSSKS
nr:MAG TPA: hypothetical protein [Caudoviricetes sp.]